MIMATRKSTIDLILGRLGHAGRFTARPMFGEYVLYADGRPVALICDDALFVKILPESSALEPHCERAPAYPGSKDHYLVPEALITADRDLPGILLRIASALPLPGSGKKASRTSGRTRS